MGFQIVIHIVGRQQVDGHVVELFHLFLENKVATEYVDAVVSLLYRLLGYQEVYRTLLQTLDIAFEQVIS